MPSHAGAATLLLPRPPVLADGVALFLDMDGVLAPMAPTPDAVGPTARRTAALKAVEARLAGRVAIVSGRTIVEIDRISGSALTSASGVHGLERRLKDGVIERDEPHDGVAEALAAFKAFAADHPGLIVEDKGVSAGLHYRQAPDQASAAQHLAQRLQAETGLTLQPGHMVLELKTPGADKGTAVTAFMQDHPFKGAIPIMLGDDLTDEHGFEAAAALGGYGVLVGPERKTAARYRLDDVDAVLSWLEAVAKA
ncbi:trehalose-phosphatase [Brevundimonas sp. SL130]|uniref:trehalose-phosphatase n=1 Tax=Brevundimonas sp. SL130 TaxID=2995143 RepID=UPI00226CA2AF|nr:trehalose-phosphatase [Brevundimonas sp. SL130]WAC60201.1 trehalose-phosphatase [Brevundimonas sp. SL130]